jgi:hypothetical protein
MSERECGARAHLDGWTEVGELGLTATIGLVVKIHEGVEHTRPRPHVDLVRDRVVVRVVERSRLVLEHLESLEVLCANRGAKHFKKSVLKVAVNLRVEFCCSTELLAVIQHVTRTFMHFLCSGSGGW